MRILKTIKYERCEIIMIKEIQEKDICECTSVIRESFKSAADDFGLTEENSPRFTAFSTTNERLYWHC